MRPPASNREPRYRVRRYMTPQLPVPVTSVEKGRKETEDQNKNIKLQTVTDPTNAGLQINQNKNIKLGKVTDPTNAEGNYKKLKQNSEEDAQESYGKSSNHDFPSVSQGTDRQSEIRVRKIIGKVVIYENSDEDEKSSDARSDYSKQSSKSSITAKPYQRKSEGREPRYRVRRYMTPQLPVPVTSVEKGRKETEVQHKDIELETVTDPTNAELQINVRDVKENNQLETAYENVPKETIISLNEALQCDNKIKSNEDNNEEIKEECTENYINLEDCEESNGYVHEDDGEMALQMNKDTQHEMSGMSLDEDNYKESTGSETNSKFLGNRSLQYMGPEQLQNDEQETGTSLMINSSMKADAVEDDLKMADITTYVDGDNKFHKIQDDALNMKMYQEQGTAVNRLPKAIAAHIHMQHHTGRNGPMKEAFSENVRNIVAEEEMEKTGEWEVDTPAKAVEFQHADESSVLQKEGELSTIEHRSALVPYDLVPESMSARSNEEMTASVPGQNELQWTQNQEINQREARWLHSSDGQGKESSREEVQNVGLSQEETMQACGIENVQVPLEAGKQRPMEGKTSSEHGEQERVLNVVEKLSGDNVPVQSPSLNSIASSDSYDATAIEPSESQVQIGTNKIPDNDDIKGNIHSITDRMDTNVPKSNHAVKQNMKSIHDKVMNADDEIFKISDNIRDSRSAHQSSVDGGLGSYGLAQIGNIVPKQFKAEDDVLGAEGALKNIPYFMDGNVAALYNEKETDNINDDLEKFAKNSIADNEDVSAALVRNAKHVGHLTPILPRMEKSRIHHVDNINGHARLQASALAKTGHIKAELEKKRLERFHALTAQRAKLKEDLLKLRVMAAEGKLKLPHHIVRRYTAQDENMESLTSHGCSDGSSDHMKLQLPTVTKTEKIKAELERKRLEMLHILEIQRARLKEDLLKLKVTSKEGKLKLPHHVRRRDTTQAEHVELLMPNTESKDVNPLISIQNKDRNGYSNIDNPSAESQNVRETNSDLMPTKSLYVTDAKLITEYESKDLKPASNENIAANQTSLESLGNYLNDIINVEAEEGTENNKVEDAQSEITHDVNLQTNEINKRFRTSDNFMNFKHENNIDSGDSEQNIVDTKIIPYELQKHVRISTYKPSYRKMRKYLYPPNYKQLAASSEEFTSTEYLNSVNNLGDKSNHSKEINDSSKEIFSIIFEDIPNISSKSIEIPETTSNNTAITVEEIPKTATEFKDISKHSKLPMSGNIMNNTHSEYVIGPNVKNWKKESSLISKTHPKDEHKYPFRTLKNVAALEQKLSDSETEENGGYSVVMDQNIGHGEALQGQNNSDNNQGENKQSAPTGNIHKFIKNIADRVVNVFHKLSPWNYFIHT
jgi:hypothetical protein